MSEHDKEKDAEESASNGVSASEPESEKESSGTVEEQVSSESLTEATDETNSNSDSSEEESASSAESQEIEQDASVGAESSASVADSQAYSTDGSNVDSTVEGAESSDKPDSLNEGDSAADSQPVSTGGSNVDSTVEGAESSDKPDSLTEGDSAADSQAGSTDGPNVDAAVEGAESSDKPDSLAEGNSDADSQAVVSSDSESDSKEESGSSEVQSQEESAFASDATPAVNGEEQDAVSQKSSTPAKIEVPNRRTFSGKGEEVEKKWILIDAEGLVVGRLASFVAYRLRGKHKPEFTPHVDDGDNVIVINAGKVALTGQKYDKKKYYWHTGYPGGIKERTAKAILEGKFPERVVEKAVKRMLPKGPLASRQYKNLRVYAGAEHPHEAQKPEVIDFGNKNPKNKMSA